MHQLFEECWKTIVDRYRLRSEDFVFFSESDVHRALANLLDIENVGSVHVEFPMPLEPDKFWVQIERFGRVTYAKGYYRTDVCILDKDVPRLISEVRWMPALVPPFQFLNEQTELFHIAQGRLVETRKRYEQLMPRWYSSKLLRNFEKFLEILRRYPKIDGYFCVLDELCPNIDEQLRKELERFHIPNNFCLCASYVE